MALGMPTPTLFLWQGGSPNEQNFTAKHERVYLGISMTNSAPSPGEEKHNSLPPCFSTTIW